jgi:hypothetical protein
LFVAGAFANAWADFDNDGDLDLFVGFGTPANRLFGTTMVCSWISLAPPVWRTRATRATAYGRHGSRRRSDLIVGFTPCRLGVEALPE